MSHWSWSDGDSRLEVTLRGDVVFKDDLSDVESISDDGLLRLRDWSLLVPRTIEIKGDHGRLTRTYYVAGVARPWDADAQAKLREQLPRLIRYSGIAAESRVRSIFERKGIDGVLDEIALLGTDYARRLYFTALVDRARPDATAIVPVLRRMDGIRSDYERTEVLQHIAHRVTLDQRAAAEYVQAVSPIKSDYERKRALTALLAVRPVPAGAAALAIRSTSDMRSDYERSEVLRTALALDPIPDPDATFTAVGRMTSSYEQHRVLGELVNRTPLSIELKRGVLTAASRIKSDYDRSEVLLAYLRHQGVDPEIRQPLFAAVDTMQSDYEKHRVLSAIAGARGAGNGDIQRSAFDSVQRMRSDYDRAEVLLAFLHSNSVEGGSRSAFVSAAERLTSSYEQNRVLGALARSERR